MHKHTDWLESYLPMYVCVCMCVIFFLDAFDRIEKETRLSETVLVTSGRHKILVMEDCHFCHKKEWNAPGRKEDTGVKKLL